MKNKLYILKENGESALIERWVWAAIYNDGTELHQFDGRDMSFHRIGEIDQDRMTGFIMYKPTEEKKEIIMPFRKGMRLIYKYKQTKPHYLDQFVTTYCFGYKDGEQYHFNFILPDDRLIVSNFENVDLPAYGLTIPKE